jgi:hypothetical protein
LTQNRYSARVDQNRYVLCTAEKRHTLKIASDPIISLCNLDRTAAEYLYSIGVKSILSLALNDVDHTASCAPKDLGLSLRFMRNLRRAAILRLILGIDKILANTLVEIGFHDPRSILISPASEVAGKVNEKRRNRKVIIKTKTVSDWREHMSSSLICLIKTYPKFRRTFYRDPALILGTNTDCSLGRILRFSDGHLIEILEKALTLADFDFGLLRR